MNINQDNKNMEQNKILKIAISGVLSYLIFKKSYSILTFLLLWLSVEMRIENEILLIILNTICGIVSFIILIFVYKRFLKNKIPLNSEVFTLISVTVLLFLIGAGINWFYGAYLSEIELDKYGAKNLYQFAWSNAIASMFSIFALGYFVRKLLTVKTTVEK